LPVKARRAKARERLPSYREPASSSPAGQAQEKRLVVSCTRAPFRLLSIRAPRQAVLRTSSWLAPFARHETLQSPGGKDARCVRPISATHTNYVYPHLVCSRLALATFAAGAPHGVLGSVRHDRGTERFTALENASAEHRGHVTSRGMPYGLPSRAWAFSSHDADCARASDTPVAPCRSPSRLPRLRGGCVSPSSSALGLGQRVGECGLTPRSPVSASRERNAS